MVSADYVHLLDKYHSKDISSVIYGKAVGREVCAWARLVTRMQAEITGPSKLCEG
jgi:hypothetical protein